MNEQANMAAHYEHEIPEGYEARIEGNKVIIELKESEDERIRQSLIGFIKLRLAKQEEYFDTGITNKAVLDWLEKQKEQKPAEWSEGTKKALDKISDYLKYKGREEDADFIKHLRPQPHWKPSKEQMIYLKEAINKFDFCDAENAGLQVLYEQLKKL